MKIDFGSELMTNQKHASVMGPESQFRIVQTQQSHIVVLSIGDDNVLYRTLETPSTKAGWSRLDECASLPAELRQPGFAARLFEISENQTVGSVDVAIAVNSQGADHLALALGQSNLDAGWNKPLEWVSIPFDDPAGQAANLVITGIYMMQDKQSSFIVVDTLKDPTSPLKLIERYFIDPSKLLSGRYWNRHELSISLQQGNLLSRIGRKSGQLVGGIYTLGTLTTSVELIYSQIYNPFNPIHGNPLVSRFQLPKNAVGQETAFALGRHPDGTTDLYVAAAGGLYYLAAAAQSDQAKLTLLFEHPLLKGVTEIGADTNGNDITVWGLNKFGKVFCLRTKLGRQQDPSSWSVPIPLLADALGLSSLLNRLVGGSVLFAHSSDGNLIQLTESPVTTLWAKRSIVLPSTDVKDMLTVTTYTTHLQVSSDDNLPSRQTTLALRAASPCSVYVNSQYTHLFVDTQVEVKTDARGTLTIMQEVNSLGAVPYFIDAGGGEIQVDPMSKARETLAGVKSGKDLDIEVTDSNGQKHPLVPSGITPQQKDDTAQGIVQFVDISKNLPPDGSVASFNVFDKTQLRAFDATRDSIFGFTYSGAPTAYFNTVEGAIAAGVLDQTTLSAAPGKVMDNAIWAAAGDIWAWLKHAFEEVEQFWVTVVDKIATCFVRIAETVYQFILDCVESVVNGINFILQKIKVFLDDLIKWLGFLFEWPDIVRTHRALKNLFKQMSRYTIAQMDVVKTDIMNAIATVEKEIAGWANLPAMAGSASSIAGSSPTQPGSNTPQANWGTYHLNENTSVSQTSYSQLVPQNSQFEQLLNELVDALTREEQVFSDVIEQLQNDVIAQFNTLTATQILEKIVAIVLNAILATFSNLIETGIDILEILVEGVIDFLDAPIDVPIISQIYREATGDQLSILDAVCLVTAIPTTILYKIAEDQAPFPDNAFTNDLIHAKDFAAIQALYKSTRADAAAGSGLTTLESVCFYVSVPAAVVMAFTVPLRSEFPNNVPLAVVGTLAYLFYCAPDLPGLVEDDRSLWYNWLNSLITSISLVKAFGDIGLTRFDKKDKTNNGKCLTFWEWISPKIEFLLNGIWFAPVVGATIANHDEAGIVACIANSGFNIGGMMALPMSSDTPEVAAAGLIGFEVGNFAYGYLNLLLGAGAGQKQLQEVHA